MQISRYSANGMSASLKPLARSEYCIARTFTLDQIIIEYWSGHCNGVRPHPSLEFLASALELFLHSVIACPSPLGIADPTDLLGLANWPIPQ